VAGDFNGDGTVDAADYVVWRDGLGTLFMPNDYNTWRNHFGQSAGAGTVFDSPGTIAVPEPWTLSAFLAFLGSLSLHRGRRRR
jgi:hypothetical protein